MGDTPAAQEHMAFDRVVVRLGGIAADPTTHVERFQPSTPLEKHLRAQVRMYADLSARQTIFSYRLVLASLLVNAGLVLLAAAVAQWYLLIVIARSSPAEETR